MTYEYRLEQVNPETTIKIKMEKERKEAEKKAAYKAEKQKIENKPTPQQS
jgi:hypothetical protein